MYITNERDTNRLHDSACMPQGYFVEFNDGVANVKEDVGEALIDKYDTITEHNND